ncbi:MAG TPA: TIR domain-containing protein [Rhodanobacteraceae bacterium]|nr:TIR domain-containing protein [Rhodanobacteraceae bacterium]
MSESSSPSRFAYRAFISYSHRDKAWADWLHKSLETYRVPSRLVGKETAAGTIPRRLHPVFRDREELASATDLGRKVNEALAQSQNLIVICSPASATSRWVNEEVLAYKRMGRAEHIFCLIVDGEPDASDMPGREAEECFCPALRFQIDASGQPGARTEPIAADARPGKDGKGNAKLKLIAGMLDVGFDALKQREQQRRVRRLTAIAAAALVIMAVTIVLAVFALISRHQAVTAQAAAERRQKQAEDLVGFMLGDLNDKLAQVQRLDIMQAVDDQAMAYFKSLPATDVSDTALEQRAKALEKIGAVRLDQGRLPSALESFQAAANLARRLANTAPKDVSRQLAYAQVLAYMGTTDFYRGRLDSALYYYESAQVPIQRAGLVAPDNLEVKYQLATIDNNIGRVLEAHGLLDKAEAQYRNSLELYQHLVATTPSNVEWTNLLGFAHNNLGKLELIRGDLAAAIGEYAAQDAIESRLSTNGPKNNDQREATTIAHATLGRTLALAGDIETGTHYLQQAVDFSSQLVAVDPHNTSFQEDLALYSTQLARVKRLSGALPAAQALSARAVAIFAAMTKQDSGNSGWQHEYAEALVEQAAESLATKETAAAQTQARAALKTLNPLFAAQPDDRDTLLVTARTKLLLAAVPGDAQTATGLRKEALRAMQRVKAGRNDPRLLALQVEALLALNQRAAAQPLIKQLQKGGYRDLALMDVLKRERIAYPPNPNFQARLLAARRPEISQAEAAR